MLDGLADRELTSRWWSAAHNAAPERKPTTDEHGDELDVRPELVNSALAGLLRFADLTRGSLVVDAAAMHGWSVTLAWREMVGGERRIFAEGQGFEQACVDCRGLLAHALASGLVST